MGKITDVAPEQKAEDMIKMRGAYAAFALANTYWDRANTALNEEKMAYWKDVASIIENKHPTAIKHQLAKR